MATESSGLLIPILNWIDGPIKQSFKNVFDGLNTSVESLDLFNAFRDKHFQALQENVSNIKVLGMSAPMPLLQVYSPLFLSTTIHRRLYEQEVLDPAKRVARRSRRKGRKICADNFVERHNRIAILGSAGSGKTTLLKYLSLAYSDKNVFDKSHLKTPKIPFYISLLEYSKKSDSLSLVDYINESLSRCSNKYASDYLNRLFEKGIAVLLLDSLDEVAFSKRDNVFVQIKEFCRHYPDCKIVLSCRTADYTHSFENFYEAELSKLTAKAVTAVVKGWFRDDKKRALLLLKHLSQDESIQSLTETPLLLSLVCIQFKYDLTLPKRKVELYQRCTEALLRDWDTSRGFRRDSAYSSLSDDRKERIFEYVAGTNFRKKIRYNFPEQKVQQQIGECCEWFGIEAHECKEVLKEIEQHHGIIERFSMDSYTFSHQSFQEYFAARYFLSKRTDLSVVKTNIDKKQWASVIEFIVALHPNPTDILENIKKQSVITGYKTYPAMAKRTKRLWLLYHCLSVGPILSLEKRRDLFRHVFLSQIEISEIYGNGNVFPIAALMKDGVRHAYFYKNKTRATLQDALQPLRWLSNEILMSPSPIYSDIAMSELCNMNLLEGNDEIMIALLMCLALPLASQIPGEVLCILEDILSANKSGFINNLVTESKEILIKSYLP